jgi:hypothetical protein
MGVFDFLRGKPRDPEEKQAEMLREEQGRGPEPGGRNPQELEYREELKHDETNPGAGMGG